jgi:oxygen-independent coproporphyrinogen-3 oxidase
LQTKETVLMARELGFSNISLDLMLGLPNSTPETLEKSLAAITDLSPQHISAYILKIEPNTVFYKTENSLNLPDEDKTAAQYLQMCEFLEGNGYSHYEISNFAKVGFESRHNLKYWHCEEYLGIGPSAHSFLDGKRFYYPRDLKAFINEGEPVFDGLGGEWEEYIMLQLRLKEGLNLTALEKRYGKTLSAHTLRKIRLLEKNGLVTTGHNSVSLTNNGFLLSNAIISEILE